MLLYLKFAFRWLTLKSLAKFFDIKELIAFIFPTTWAYYETIPKLVDCPKAVLIASVVVILVVLFLYNLYARYVEHEKAIAEVLETGYFTNFMDKTAYMLGDRKERNQAVLFKFKDGTEHWVKPQNIKVKVILPQSFNELIECIKKVDSIAKTGTIDNGAWVIAKATIENEATVITIYECPRTLQALSRYIADYSEEQSKRMHRLFNEKFEKDWKSEIGRIPVEMFTFSATVD